MGTYIVVEDATGDIVNRIVLNDPGAWQVPEAHTIVEDTADPMAIGGSYIDGAYTPPPQPEPPPFEPPTEDVVLYDHENRLRALEGQPPLSMEEFREK